MICGNSLFYFVPIIIKNSSQTNLTGINPALISTQVDSPPTTSGIPDGGS